MAGLLSFAQSGGFDGALLTSEQFYRTDYTKPLLLLADGGLLLSRAQAEHLLGTQWGMMNETWGRVLGRRRNSSVGASLWLLSRGYVVGYAGQGARVAGEFRHGDWSSRQPEGELHVL